MALRSNGAARFLLTKNSTLVLCRLGSWPCGGPCKVCGGVCECVLSTACPRCTPHGGLCIRMCVCVCGEGVVHGFTLMGKVVVAGCEPRLHKKRKN